MAKLSIYIPDEMAGRIKAAGLNASGIAQQAFNEALRAASTDAWLAEIASIPADVDHETVMDALDAVRTERPTRHG